jgi:hypothetical protein
MKILNGILNFLKNAFSSKYLFVTMSVIILILIVLLFGTCDRLRKEKTNREKDIAMYENNIYIMNDTIRTYYDKKLDRMVSEKTSYIIKTVDDLKKYNQDLYNEFKNVKNIVAGLKSDVNIIIPTLTSEINKIIPDPMDSTKFTIPWKFNYNDEGLTHNIFGSTKFNVFNGKPILPTSILDTNIINIKLRYTYTLENGKYLVKASSPSKLVKFTELDGALILDNISSEQKITNSWAIGPYIGYGINTDYKLQGFRFGWSAGFSVTYNILHKKNKKQ